MHGQMRQDKDFLRSKRLLRKDSWLYPLAMISLAVLASLSLLPTSATTGADLPPREDTHDRSVVSACISVTVARLFGQESSALIAVMIIGR